MTRRWLVMEEEEALPTIASLRQLTALFSASFLLLLHCLVFPQVLHCPAPGKEGVFLPPTTAFGRRNFFLPSLLPPSIPFPTAAVRPTVSFLPSLPAQNNSKEGPFPSYLSALASLNLHFFLRKVGEFVQVGDCGRTKETFEPKMFVVYGGVCAKRMQVFPDIPSEKKHE